MFKIANHMLLYILTALTFLIFCIAILFWILVPYFLEKPKFNVLFSDGSIQIREYQSMISASIVTKGERYDGLRAGFVPLARYIGAKDRDGKKISMTAPVVQRKHLSKDTWTISFMMPAEYQLHQLPGSSNKDIQLQQIPTQTLAVISFNGIAQQILLDAKLKELKSWLNGSDFISLDDFEPRFAYYNDPSTPGIFRTNEVLIPVRRK